jgi:hypothetical protein
LRDRGKDWRTRLPMPLDPAAGLTALTDPRRCSMFVLMVEVETLGVAGSLGWKVPMRCAKGYRESTRSIRRCVYRKQLDLDTWLSPLGTPGQLRGALWVLHRGALSSQTRHQSEMGLTRLVVEVEKQIMKRKVASAGHRTLRCGARNPKDVIAGAARLDS